MVAQARKQKKPHWILVLIIGAILSGLFDNVFLVPVTYAWYLATQLTTSVWLWFAHLNWNDIKQVSFFWLLLVMSLLAIIIVIGALCFFCYDLYQKWRSRAKPIIPDLPDLNLFPRLPSTDDMFLQPLKPFIGAKMEENYQKATHGYNGVIR